MIYALTSIVIGLFLVIFASLAYVWTIRESFAAKFDQHSANFIAIRQNLTENVTQIGWLKERLDVLTSRPDAPAVEQYKRVLGELEDFGHTIRTLEHRMDETLESVRRTQNKIAARATRGEKPKIVAQIEADESLAYLTEPEVVIETPRRRFGTMRG